MQDLNPSIAAADVLLTLAPCPAMTEYRASVAKGAGGFDHYPAPAEIRRDASGNGQHGHRRGGVEIIGLLRPKARGMEFHLITWVLSKPSDTGDAITIIRVFPQRTSYTPTDDLAFVGDPPFPAMQPRADEVHVSVTFTWDINEGKRLAEAWSRFYPVVKLGGPAMGSPAEAFVSGQYVRTGYTFTSRGCIRRCPFCFVPQREGGLRELADFPVGNLVNDNNLLACSEAHIRRVFAMLNTQKDIEFPGGLDARIIKPWHVEAMRELDIHQLFLAYDGAGQRDACARAVAMLRAAGFTQRQVRIYMLVGFQEDTPELALARLEDGFAMGGLPFAMRYRDENGKYRIDPAYHELCRTWTRPAATFAAMKE